MVNRLGKVDEGNDGHRLRRRRNRPQAHACPPASPTREWNKTKINLIDTPGHSATSCRDARAALRVADGALVVVDAVAGVEVSDRESVGGRRGAAAAAADRRQPPRSRARQPRAHARVDARDARPHDACPIQLPIGEEKDFSGVVDLVVDEGATRSPPTARGKMTEGAVPDDAGRRRRQRAREALIEMVAEADEALMEKFFEAGTLTQDELIGGLATRDARRRRSSRWSARRALRNIGAAAADGCDRSPTCPSPADRPFTGIDATAQTTTRSRPTTRRRCALCVWKTVADQFAGRITMFRVVPGRAEGGLDRAQRHAATRRSGSATCSRCRARRRRTCRSSRPATSARSRS